MSERKLQHGPRIDAADKSTLERSVGANTFDSRNDSLVNKTVPPSAAARSAIFTLWIDTGNVRDILLDRFSRFPHRHWVLLPGNIRQAGLFLRRCGGVDFLVLGIRRQRSCMRPR
jgi:hypothetical protein